MHYLDNSVRYGGRCHSDVECPYNHCLSKERSLRKRSMYFLINQAVADMFVGAGVISDSFTSGEVCGFWKIHHVSEPVNSILWFVFLSASFTNLTAISLERAHATFCPFKHRFLKKKIFGAVIAAVWITAWLFFASIMVLHGIQILNLNDSNP